MYFYAINYNEDEKNLCMMEMKHLFGSDIIDKHFYSNVNIDSSRSPFIKYKIKILYAEDTIDEIKDKIIKENISYENFKVKFIIAEEKVEFNLKHKIEGILGYVVNGEAKIHNPDINLAVTYYKNKWIFGELDKNEGIWKVHDVKPYYYCNALSTKTSRAAVNIAIDNNMNLKLVDPCCGIGTVVIEALSMNINIKGFDSNPKIVEEANGNLSFFNMPQVIDVCDINNLKDKFDVSIVDIPYGILSITSIDEQKNILENARRISDKMILISIDRMEDTLKECGFHVIECCDMPKGKFSRYLSICM